MRRWIKQSTKGAPTAPIDRHASPAATPVSERSEDPDFPGETKSSRLGKILE
jgi:hypothetical protein